MFNGKRRKLLFAGLPIQERVKSAQQQVQLWRAVLDQVFADALIVPLNKDREDYKAHLEALVWFEKDQEDFETVCYLAALDPKIIRRMYNHFKEQKP